MPGYRDVADHLQRRIEAGEFPAGTTLPIITDLMIEYDVARQTVRTAISVLADNGLVVPIRKKGTVVRDRSPVRIPLSRYLEVLSPGGTRGPWESACASQGLDGRMETKRVQHVQADSDLASLLRVAPGTELVQRRRHAFVGAEILQLQDAWYPADVAANADIARTSKIEGGVYAALIANGYVLAHAAEVVGTRMPDRDEQTLLRIGAGVPLLIIQRLTRDRGGAVVEVLRVRAVGDRIQLIYDPLPLSGEHHDQ